VAGIGDSAHFPNSFMVQTAQLGTSRFRSVEATSVQQAGGAPVVYATLDGAAVATTMSNGNLTATHNAATTADGVRSTALKTSGKYYFEVTRGVNGANPGGATCFMGIILSTGLVGDPATGTNVSACYPNQAGGVYSNNTFTNKTVGAAVAPGDLVGIAIDLDNRKAWFCKNNLNWLNAVIGSENPATNTGGVVIAAGSWTPAVGFLGSGAVVGDSFTANFGASAFSGTVPSGFTSGWPS